MRWYKADLHIHSVLSPCGGLDMSPRRVMASARQAGLHILSITDHNSAANLGVYEEAARAAGLYFIPGIEVQSREEIHTVCLFPDTGSAESFAAELYNSLAPLENNAEYFGDQVVIDRDENIIRFETRALINSSSWEFETVLEKVDTVGGFPWPAHVDRQTYSLLGQLGFVPDNPLILALGITRSCQAAEFLATHPDLRKYALIRSSDAHHPEDVGSGFTEFYLEKPELAEIRLACLQSLGRKYKI